MNFDLLDLCLVLVAALVGSVLGVLAVLVDEGIDLLRKLRAR